VHDQASRQPSASASAQPAAPNRRQQAAAAIYRETGDRHSEGMALNDLESARAAQQA
jgi:hypothetical protein